MKEKKYLYAIFLQAICPGTGYLYIGKQWLFLLYYLSTLLFLWFFYYSSYVAHGTIKIMVLAGFVPFIIFSWWHVLFLIKKKQKLFKMRWFNKWYLYIILIAFISIFDAPSTPFFAIKASSMSPSLIQGDQITTDPIQKIEPGDIVVFKAPYNKNIRLTMRVIGLPKDKIRVEANRIFINNQETKRELLKNVHPQDYLPSKFETYSFEAHKETIGNNSYTIFLLPNGPTNSFPEQIIPEDQYFVLGDNRNFSLDSTRFGFISRDDILSMPSYIYFNLKKPLRIARKIK